jgi:hypothetical protein
MSGSDGHLSSILRRQLQELRIDPDVASTDRRTNPRRLSTWCRQHKEGLILAAVGLTMLLFLSAVIAVMVNSAQSASPTFNRPKAVSVSYSASTVQVAPPVFRHLPPDQAVVAVNLQLHNVADAQSELHAGDLLLADARGALFPVSWHDADGAALDGLADPKHTLLALDPGADAIVQVDFLVLSDGPFTLRYQPRGAQPSLQIQLN